MRPITSLVSRIKQSKKCSYLTNCNVATNKNHFMFHYVIGRGGFGKVWKVEKKKEKKLYAMKEMHKGRII